METSAVIVWERNGEQKDFITVTGGKQAIKSYLIDCLQNKPNDILQVDWSNFGEAGDCIKIQ